MSTYHQTDLVLINLLGYTSSIFLYFFPLHSAFFDLLLGNLIGIFFQHFDSGPLSLSFCRSFTNCEAHEDPPTTIEAAGRPDALPGPPAALPVGMGQYLLRRNGNCGGAEMQIKTGMIVLVLFKIPLLLKMGGDVNRQ